VVANDPNGEDVEKEDQLNNAIETVVVSDSLTTYDLGVWRETTASSADPMPSPSCVVQYGAMAATSLLSAAAPLGTLPCGRPR
jgi:hypothetical protein